MQLSEENYEIALTMIIIWIFLALFPLRRGKKLFKTLETITDEIKIIQRVNFPSS